MRILLLVLLAGCSGPMLSYADEEPGPGPGGPFGGDGTIDLVAAYFSFTIDAEHASGDMGAHCGFDDWTMDPPSVRLHIGGGDAPTATVMRQIHPHQSTEGIASFGIAPYAVESIVPRAFGPGALGEVVFGQGASFRGIAIPEDRWVLVPTDYEVPSGEGTWHVTETLHLRLFRDVPVEFDREPRLCA